ncbi:MAG: DUF4880 domain-containing protein [Gammaproteobacteria bacterium]
MSTDRTNEIEEVASDWLIRRESGDWTEADRARFEQWLDASTLNRVAFLRLELAWEESGRLKALGAGIPGDRPPQPGRWNVTAFYEPGRADSERHAPDAHRARRLAIAAGVLLAVAAGMGGYIALFASGDRYNHARGWPRICPHA